MTDGKVVSLRGEAINAEPDQRVVAALEELLSMAKSGLLRSFIGTGFNRDGLRLATWIDTHPNVHEMLGALAWLQAEYIHRHTNGS